MSKTVDATLPVVYSYGVGTDGPGSRFIRGGIQRLFVSPTVRIHREPAHHRGGFKKPFIFVENEMTVREIAQAVGKDERSVARWVSSLSDKMTEISDKVSKAKATSKAADYSLFETCAIIEEGMGQAAASIYRANAKPEKKTGKITPYSASFIREVRLALGKEAAAALLTGLPIEAKKPITIEAPKTLPEEVARQVYAVASKAIESYYRKQRIEALSPSLFVQAPKEAAE